MRLLRIAAAALLMGMPIARAEDAASAVEIFTAGPMVARLWLPLRAPGAALPRGIVVVVGDLLAPDARGDRIMEQLNAAGLVAVELIAADGGGEPVTMQDSLQTALRSLVSTLATERRLETGRVGLLAFGAGAHAAFANLRHPPELEGGWSAVALLHPGCATLPARLGGAGRPKTMWPVPLLLMHGSDDPANPPAACANLVEALGPLRLAQRTEYRGVGYAWDRPKFDDRAPEALPRPDDEGRVPGALWPALAELSAERITSFFCRALAAP